MDKPKCVVRGLIARHGMCGSVITGGLFCGNKADCKHKIETPDPTEMPGDKERWAATCTTMLKTPNV